MKADRPILTSAMVGLFVLGMLYKNWLGQIKQWIHDKVAESAGSGASSAVTTNPSTGKLQVTNPDPTQPPLQIYG